MPRRAKPSAPSPRLTLARGRTFDLSFWMGVGAHLLIFGAMFWPNSPKALQLIALATFVLNHHQPTIRKVVAKVVKK